MVLEALLTGDILFSLVLGINPFHDRNDEDEKIQLSDCQIRIPFSRKKKNFSAVNVADKISKYTLGPIQFKFVDL